MKLIDYDPLSGMKTYVDYNHSDDCGVLKIEQNVQPILDRNKVLYNEPDHRRHGMKENFLHVATIPNSIIEKWLVEEKISIFRKEDWPRIQKKLNDPEYRFLRASAGRV